MQGYAGARLSFLPCASFTEFSDLRTSLSHVREPSEKNLSLGTSGHQDVSSLFCRQTSG